MATTNIETAQMQPSKRPPSADPRKRFEELVRLLLNDLFRIACRLESDQGSAEDLLQETLLTGFRKFHQLRERDSFRAWMTRIMHRRFLNRCSRIHTEHLMDEESLNAIGCQLPQSLRMSPEEKFHAKRLTTEIKLALQALPMDQRLAVTLVDLQGFSYAETAHILDASPGTVASRIARGRDALRRSLRHVARERGWL